MKKMFIDFNPLYIRVAITENGELAEFYVEKSSAQGLVGNIYKGKVINVLSGMKAAFVDIGLEKNGFLYVGEQSLADEYMQKKKKYKDELCLSAGDTVMCQVVKDQFGDKGVRLSTEITIAGRKLVMMPKSNFCGVSKKITDPLRKAYLEQFVKASSPQNTGFIVRTCAYKATDAELQQEIDELKTVWENILSNYQKIESGLVFKEADLVIRAIRDILTDDVDQVIINDKKLYESLSGKNGFAEKNGLDGKEGHAKFTLYEGEENIFSYYRLERKIDKLCDRVVRLKNGAYIVIDKTEALTVVDVNTGKFVGGVDLEDTVYKTNLAAAEEIARQLRLRNIGGIVIIDFIDMTDLEHKKEVVNALKEALKNDRLKTTAVSMTNLGLVELTRKKSRLPLDSYLLRECPHCRHGFILSYESVIMHLREAVMREIMNSRPGTLFVEVNPDLCEKLFESKLLSQECRTVWKDRRVYIITNNRLRFEEFTILPEYSKVPVLPSGARLLY